MEPLDISLFKVYSWGIVADNKAMSSKIINVLPVEYTSMVDGELCSNPQVLKTKGKDKDGQAYEDSATVDNVKECTWLPFGTNRVTAPDVRRGEPVLIWNYGNTDKYYWTIPGLKDDLRRLETVVYAFNGNPEVESKEFDPEDHYYLEISTHSKQITLRTSNKNGEPFKYTFQFNTNDGIVTLADDTNNFFELDTKEITMKMELNTGTKLHLDKMNFLLEAIENGVIKVGESTITMTPSSITNKTGGTIMEWIPSKTSLITPSFEGSQ